MRIAFIFLLIFPVLFVRGQAVRNDVVIDEIMADPAPTAGLPEAEFIELKNVSAKPVNLSGWKISDATGTATITTGFILQPDSFVTICSNSAAAALAAFGPAIGAGSFPSLDNDGEVLVLRSREGRLIHAVDYRKSWYGNPVKAEGGWTLEMIDTRNACSGAVNWKASTAGPGGTPGHQNAADAPNTDRDPPAVLKAYATDSLSIVLVFTEPLDSVPASAASAYEISDGIGMPAAATALVPLFNRVLLRLNRALQKDKIYLVSIRPVSDCSGNPGAFTTVRTGWASQAAPGDAVIDEILFNPRPDGTDYLEIYNRSNRIIDLKDLYIASRNATGTTGPLRQAGTESSLLFPKAYVAITENVRTIQQQYLCRDPGAFTEVSAMPSWPDDKGTVLLLNAAGVIIDELQYSDKWHFALLDNTEGIALERISYLGPTQDPHNWHSAATTAGYGTPGYQNSQFKAEEQVKGTISIAPRVFSPDNDGFNDVTTIVYRFTEPGYVCNITIFDTNGKPVRLLARNAICGLTGYFTWDGLDENRNRLGVGIYIMMAETFNLQGSTQKYKQAIVVAKKL